MKKIVLLVASMMLTIIVSQAQTPQEKKVRREIKSLNKKTDPNAKSQKKNLRRELRLLKGHDVSNAAKDQFRIDFGSFPDEKWERTANFDKVEFVKNGIAMAAFYDADSKLVGTTAVKQFSDLPAKAQKAINEKYNGYVKGQVIFFEDNQHNDMDMILYGQQFEDADNYFIELSKDGKNIVLQITPTGAVSYFATMK